VFGATQVISIFLRSDLVNPVRRPLLTRPSISGANLLKADTLHTDGDVANLEHRNFTGFVQSVQFYH